MLEKRSSLSFFEEDEQGTISEKVGSENVGVKPAYVGWMLPKAQRNRDFFSKRTSGGAETQNRKHLLTVLQLSEAREDE